MDITKIKLLRMRYDQRLKQSDEALARYAERPPKHPISPPYISVPRQELRELTQAVQPKADDSEDQRKTLEILREGAQEAGSKEPAILLEHLKFLLDRIAPE